MTWETQFDKETFGLFTVRFSSNRYPVCGTVQRFLLAVCHRPGFLRVLSGFSNSWQINVMFKSKTTSPAIQLINKILKIVLLNKFHFETKNRPMLVPNMVPVHHHELFQSRIFVFWRSWSSGPAKRNRVFPVGKCGTLCCDSCWPGWTFRPTWRIWPASPWTYSLWLKASKHPTRMWPILRRSRARAVNDHGRFQSDTWWLILFIYFLTCPLSCHLNK